MKTNGPNDYRISPLLYGRGRDRFRRWQDNTTFKAARLRYDLFKAYCLHRSELLQGVEQRKFFYDIMKCDDTDAGIARFNWYLSFLTSEGNVCVNKQGVYTRTEALEEDRERKTAAVQQFKTEALKRWTSPNTVLGIAVDICGLSNYDTLKDDGILTYALWDLQRDGLLVEHQYKEDRLGGISFVASDPREHPLVLIPGMSRDAAYATLMEVTDVYSRDSTEDRLDVVLFLRGLIQFLAPLRYISRWNPIKGHADEVYLRMPMNLPPLRAVGNLLTTSTVRDIERYAHVRENINEYRIVEEKAIQLYIGA